MAAPTPVTDSVAEAAAVVRDGGTVVYPTETCYGLGCDATDADAARRVYDIKARPRDKPLTVIVGSLDDAERYCTLSDRERRVCEAFMPGPLTLIADKRDGAVPDIVNPAFAFRVPGSDTARTLADTAGTPVVATSANVSGEQPAFSLAELDPAVREGADCLLDGGTLEEGPSSTIADLRDGLDILREGPVSTDAIRGVIDGGE